MSPDVDTTPVNNDIVSAPDTRTDAEKARDQREYDCEKAFQDIYPILGEMELQLREQGLSLPRILADLIKTTPYKVQF